MPKLPGRVEFIALLASMFALLAFSIDAMLPALPDIAAELSPNAVNQAQLVVTAFVLGIGTGTFFSGPLSDIYGRRSVVWYGFALYLFGALLSYAAGSLYWLLAARFVQGLGSSGPRVAGMAIVRDAFAGRDMAKVMSFVMMVFTLVPAFAPLTGTLIIALAGWRAIFLGFAIFALCGATWFTLRMPETHPPEKRSALDLRAMRDALREVWRLPMVRMAILIQTLISGFLFGIITNIHPIFDVTYDQAKSFPYWFALIALLSASSSYVNARLVGSFGMRRMCFFGLICQAGFSGVFFLMLATNFLPEAHFVILLFWVFSLFFTVALTIGNMNSIAMEPLGHVAGMAASVIAALSTVGGVLLTIPVILIFNGTALPLAIYVCALSASAALLLKSPAMRESPSQN